MANIRRCGHGDTRIGSAGRPAAALAALIPLTLVIFACEGPQGPPGAPGEGVGDLDTQPPTVRFTSPTRSDTVYADTFSVAATATDNRGIAFVEFFLDGSNVMGEVSAVDSTAPYTWTWSFAETGRTFGIYPLIARAVDTGNNAADTPPLLIHYQEIPENELLTYFGNGSLSYMTMPDEFRDRFFNVRFTPVTECTLLEVQFEFLEPTSAQFLLSGDPVTAGADMMVFSWASNANDALPAEPPLDSLLLPEAEIVYDEWTVRDVSDWERSFAGDFHVGYSVPPDANYDQLLDQRRAIPIITHYMEEGLGNPALDRSSEYDPDLGWGTMQEHWDSEIQFHIRVLVEYSTGERAMLTPAAGSQGASEIPTRDMR